MRGLTRIARFVRELSTTFPAEQAANHGEIAQERYAVLRVELDVLLQARQQQDAARPERSRLVRTRWISNVGKLDREREEGQDGYVWHPG